MMTAAQISEAARFRARDGRGFKALLELVKTWRRRAYERQALAGMSDHLLRDIGVTRCDAMNEASKPFWRA
jgi:uncharacterized protein YjiS (DUF1127 family)